MMKILPRLAAFVAAAFLMVHLTACSNGGSTGTSETGTGSGTATVGILLTDKPADPSLFREINATITQVELLGSDENEEEGEGKVVLYSGIFEKVDLLELKNESIPLTFSNDVPAGTYCKIRLILDELELVFVDESEDNVYPDLPGNGKLDLVFGECIGIAPGDVITLQIDVDAGNSIHIVEAGKSGNVFYNFRPVIHVDVFGDDGFEAKLTRVSGEITEVDTINEQLTLCGLPAFGSNPDDCALVDLGGGSTYYDHIAYFDNVDYAGGPRPLSELLSVDMIGKTVTVVGLPREMLSAFGEGEEEEEEGHVVLYLDALVIEYGDFLTLRGAAATDADAFGFDMEVDSGPIQTQPGEVLPVEFQPGTVDFNGTRIVSKQGTLLDETDILELRELSVDGVLSLSSLNDVLKAALVIVDTQSDDDQITGTVLSVDSGSFILSPDTLPACGVTADLSVTTTNAEIMTVVITSSGSEITEGGVLEAGQSVGLVGSCTMSGYDAVTIVIIDDQRV